MKIEAAARLKAAKANYATIAQVTRFLKTIGFKTIKSGSGSYISTQLPWQTKIKPLKEEWNTTKGNGSDGNPCMIFTNSAGAKFEITLPSTRNQCYVHFYEDTFKNEDIDVYNVTKYHPAWAFVQDYVDHLGKTTKDKAAVKKAVDAYAAELGYTDASELKGIIADRTKRKVYDKLADHY